MSDDEARVVEYGQLIVLGYTSYRVVTKRSANQLWEPMGRTNSIFPLSRRPMGNGQRILTSHDLPETTTTTGSSYQGHVIVQMDNLDKRRIPFEFTFDRQWDMFQLGRAPAPVNDVVIPGPLYATSGSRTSTISRFAARILCPRDNSGSSPSLPILYAGGFDLAHELELCAKSPKYCLDCQHWFTTRSSSRQDPPDDHQTHAKDCTFRHWDGLTKNGIRLWLPSRKRWYEVSVRGQCFEIVVDKKQETKDSTSTKQHLFHRPKSPPASDVSSTLEDGSIIDLGGVQLQYQQQQQQHSSTTTIRSSVVTCVASRLESLALECPINFQSLHFLIPGSSSPNPEQLAQEQQPHVYPNCGHVVGYHDQLEKERHCPLCRTRGPLVLLKLLEEDSFTTRVKREEPRRTHVIPEVVLNPCGHAMSETSAVVYTTIMMPCGRSICPICARELDHERPFSKLFFHTAWLYGGLWSSAAISWSIALCLVTWRATVTRLFEWGKWETRQDERDKTCIWKVTSVASQWINILHTFSGG